MTTNHESEIPTGTHCEWCGAEFDNPAGPRIGKVRVPTAEPAPSEPATHCEWCGVAYPEPGVDDSSPSKRTA